MAITEPEVAPPWGETAAGTDLTRPTDGFISAGWPLSSIPPSRQFFNWLLRQAHNGVRYLMTRGIPNWNSGEASYPAGAIVRDTLTDGLGFTRRSFYYLHGTAITGTAPHSDPTNWSLIADMPIGQATNWPREIWAWRNAQQLRRFGIDRLGFPGGLITAWQEDWADNGFTTISVAGFGSWNRRWSFQYGVTGGTLAGGGIQILPAGIGGSPGSRTPGLSMNPFPNGGATAWCLVEESIASFNANPDTSHVMEWSGQPGGSTSWSAGLMAGTQIGLSVESVTSLVGMAIVRRAADANFQVYTNIDGATPIFTNTGIAVSGDRRFKIECQGANAADGGTARVVAFIDGVPIPVSAAFGTSFVLHPAPLRMFFRGWNATSLSSAGSVGIAKFRGNLGTGDLFI